MDVYRSLFELTRLLRVVAQVAGSEAPVLRAGWVFQRCCRAGEACGTIVLKGDRAMGISQEMERLLAAMTRAEKAQLLQWVVRDLGDAFPGIESTPGICGSAACVVRTRIPVW